MRILKTISLIILGLYIAPNSRAQHTDNPELKLSKSDRMWLAAYDDTTKALALLFIARRNKANKQNEINYIVAGVSSAVLLTGVLLSERNPNQTPDGVSMDFLFPLLGSVGLLSAGIGFIGNAVELHPYTIKKYHRLLEQHTDSKPLPPFYQKRITKYLP